MTTELAVLAWGCLLAIVHIWLPIRAKTAQYGIKWNMSPRDETQAPPGAMAGRLERAQANFFETFPLMIAAVAIVSIADLETRWTAIGALVWLAARAYRKTGARFRGRRLPSLGGKFVQATWAGAISSGSRST